jgi:hypothetical protein
MAANNIRWIGNAAAVAQVDTFDPGDVSESDTFTLTVTGWDGRTVSFTSTAGAGEDEGDVVDDLVAAWNASTDVLCTGITAAKVGADAAATMTLTADTAGTAFSVSPTTVGGSFTRTATTANEGPYDWSTAKNWDSGAVPGSVADSTVYVEGATILYGLDNSSMSNALVKLVVRGSQIGTNPEDGCLPVYLQIKSAIIDIGEHYGPSSLTEGTPVLINSGTTAAAITVHNSATNTSKPSVYIKANSASTTVVVKKGYVGIGYGDGETTVVSAITSLYVTQKATDANVFIGNGVTVTTINHNGVMILRSAATTVNSNAGTLTTEGSGAITTLNLNGATVISNSTGTITTANIESGTLDTLKSNAARTFTTIKLNPGGTFKRNSAITVTNMLTADSSVVYTAQAA